MSLVSPLFHTEDIVRYDNGHRRPGSAHLVRETSLALMVNEKHLATLVCSPQDYRQLAVGYLFSGGVIAGYDDITDLAWEQSSQVVWVQTKTAFAAQGRRQDAAPLNARQIIAAHGLEETIAGTVFKAADILRLIRQLDQSSVVFSQTGGVHSAGLGGQGGLTAAYEDIGRHNAVDKVLGHVLMQGLGVADKCLLLTCRVASEILIKAVRLRVPLVVSRSAPTELAVELAQTLGITLIGFARGDGMNIYCHGERVGD